MTRGGKEAAERMRFFMLQDNSQKKIDAAQKAYDQAKARLEAEKKKQSEKRRHFENHHKFMMGGAVVKYFPECYSFDEKEMNRIIAAGMKSEECRRVVQIVIAEAAEKKAAKEAGKAGGPVSEPEDTDDPEER